MGRGAGTGCGQQIVEYIEIGVMQLLAKLPPIVPPIDLCDRLGLDAPMYGATQVMPRFPMGLV